VPAAALRGKTQKQKHAAAERGEARMEERERVARNIVVVRRQAARLL